MKIFILSFLCTFITFSAVSQTKFDNAVRLFDSGRIAQSKPLFLEAVKEDPNKAEAYYYLGILAINNDYDGAIDYLKKAVDLNGAAAKYHFMLGNAYGVKAQRAGLLSKFGAASNCKEQYLIAVSLDPKYTDARGNLMEYYLQAPGIIGGSVEKAEAEADTIKTYDLYAGYLAEARVRKYQKQKAQETECYIKAISTDPKKLDAYCPLWFFYMDESNGIKADELFKKAAATVDKKSDLYYWCGLYYVWNSKFSKARDMFEVALKKDSLNYPVYYQLGTVDLLMPGDLYRGLAYFEKYMNAPQIKNSPGPEYAYWRMGMIYEKLGKIDSSRSAYRKSLDLNPDLEDAKKALEKLN